MSKVVAASRQAWGQKKAALNHMLAIWGGFGHPGSNAIQDSEVRQGQSNQDVHGE